MTDFFTRFSAPGPANPPGLQLLFADPPAVPGDALTAVLRDYHPDLSAAAAEIVPAADLPPGARVVSPDGPPAAAVGLAAWGEHAVRLIVFHTPMPEG